MSAAVILPPVDPDASAALRQRHDGWTPDRQRAFCEAIAEGETVADACAGIGMAVSTAYALRRRASGAAFALGWDAARLLGRERLGDELHARAVAGNVETITRSDGATVTRHRYDNRLATMMLRRADRYADGQAGAQGQAARLVAAEFDAFLDVIARDEGPARAGLFLGTRIGGEDAEALAPVMALARADTWLRTGAGRGGEVDIADLDPARRAGWSAEQWTRAEAAGLIALAPPPPEAEAHAAPAESVTSPPLPPLCPADPPAPVWWNDLDETWRTRFPPPDYYFGEEDGRYGEPDYARVLDDGEVALVEAARKAVNAPRLVREARERDQWFAELTANAMHDRAEAEALRNEQDAQDTDDDDVANGGADGGQGRGEGSDSGFPASGFWQASGGVGERIADAPVLPPPASPDLLSGPAAPI